ncbi:MAG: phosphonate ABC transporter, permease protein PhnE [Sedimentibacter sp.]
MNTNNKIMNIEITSHKQKNFLLITIVLVVGLYVISIVNLDLNLNLGIEYFLKAIDIIGKMIHFDLSEWEDVISAALTSLAVAALATIISAIFAFFVSFMAADNVSNGMVAKICKGIAAWIRAIPTLIWTLIFVAYLGLGPFPGVLGLSLHSFAYLLKAFSQSIEEVKEENIEALKSTGASWLLVMTKAVFPSIITSLISWVALRFEINVGESSILGFVGAGGIGHEVSTNMRGFEFEKAGFVVFIIFLMSFGIEMTFHKFKLNVDKNQFK